MIALPNGLRFVDAASEKDFMDMSRLHALGWRDTYRGYIPQDYLDREITDSRWLSVFRENYETQNGCRGLLLCRGDVPVSCVNYCPARLFNYNTREVCRFPNEGYLDWGEIASIYTHPDERGKHYGGFLLDEALERLRDMGFRDAFVFVLRENARARDFYASHGFSWDGTDTKIPFPPDTVLTDLRYVKKLQ